MDLGTDVKVLVGDYEKSATGDLQEIDGLLNLREAIYRRISTPKGQVVHRTKYGIGIDQYRNKPATPANRAELSNEIKMGISAEQRIETIHSVKCDWDYTGTVNISIEVTAYGRLVQFEYKVVKI